MNNLAVDGHGVRGQDQGGVFDHHQERDGGRQLHLGRQDGGCLGEWTQMCNDS